MSRNQVSHEWSTENGWSKLVNPLIRTLQDIGCTILQTKEKFGEFRCYFVPPDDMPQHVVDTLYHAVDAVTRRSRRTCTICGNATDTRMCTDGWVLPLCKKHAAEEGRDWDNGKEEPGWSTEAYRIDVEDEASVNTDPVFKTGDGEYYFWDETWANNEGPFATEEEARAALEKYAATL